MKKAIAIVLATAFISANASNIIYAPNGYDCKPSGSKCLCTQSESEYFDKSVLVNAPCAEEVMAISEEGEMGGGDHAMVYGILGITNFKVQSNVPVTIDYSYHSNWMTGSSGGSWICWTEDNSRNCPFILK